jgi:hypothetical protein
MKITSQIFFFIGVSIFIFSYFIDPYKINEGHDIVIDEDTIGFLKMLYTITCLFFGFLFYIFLRIFKNKTYTIFSLILLIVNLAFLFRMFLYFDTFLK